MKDWIQIAINAVICIAVIGFMALFYGQMQTTNMALLSALDDRSGPVGLEYPSVEFILHRGSIDGPAVEGIRVDLEGSAFKDERTKIVESSDTRGAAKFGPIRAGRYTAVVYDDETGLRNRQWITLYVGDRTKTVHVSLPPVEPVALDLTAPLRDQIENEDCRIVMAMTRSWQHDGNEWNFSVGKKVIATSSGLFSAGTGVTDDSMYNQGEKITEVLGNRVSFSLVGVAKLLPESKKGRDLFGRIYGREGDKLYRSVRFSHDLRVGAANSLVLDLPVEFLDEYDFQVRKSANENHGLPQQFRWFTDHITRNFPEFVIHDAQLIEQGIRYQWLHNRLFVYRGHRSDFDVTGQNGVTYSLRKLPKNIPDGYKLLLAFEVDVRKIYELDAHLSAYLDIASALDGSTTPIDVDPVRPAGEPIWRLDAKSIRSSARIFVDLTSVMNGDPDFMNASGVFFKWETPSGNQIYLPMPEEADGRSQPVWLVMKPIAKAMASNAAEI